MLRMLSLVTTLVLFWHPVNAQQNHIALYSDAGYTDCKLSDAGPGLVNVYVVHKSGGGATASQFKVQAGPGVTLSYLRDTLQPPSLSLGDTQNGITVAYSGCRYSEILVVTISYFASGTSRNCSTLSVVPDPAIGVIQVVDCGSFKLEGTGARLVINPDGTCDCGPTTQITNWGRIKAQYE
jgi:hypothetical protein